MRKAISVLFVTLLVTVSGNAGCPPMGNDWCSGIYGYDGVGNVWVIGDDHYVYDKLSRLKIGSVNSSPNGNVQWYTYDAFGNRTSASRDPNYALGCIGGCETNPSISLSTNRITSGGATYDDAGNLTFIQDTMNGVTYSASYAYDAAGSLTQANATQPSATDARQFIYTADDERLATKKGDTWTWTVRGLDNKVLREFTSGEQNGLPIASRVWVKDYVYRDDLLLASVTPTATLHYHLDHLGTPRVVTDNGGHQIGLHTYYPFGAELNLSPTEVPAELLKFTGHERDVLGNDPHTLDDMHARYYMATEGRFLSVDPVRGHPDEPQSWNRYSYVANNPVSRSDPTGKCPTCIGALVGGIVGVTITGVHEIKTSLHEPVTLAGSSRRVLGAFVGGAISGAAATVPGGGVVRLAAAITGTAGGGAVNRTIAGEEHTLDAVQRDVIGGAAGFGLGEVGSVVVKSIAQSSIDSLTMQAAVLRADAAAENLGLGADKVATQTIQSIQTNIRAAGVATGETASNLVGRALPPPPPADKAPEKPED